MLERLIHKSLHRPVATLVIFFAIVTAGAYAALNLPLEILPSVEFPRLFVQTAWPGASPVAVEAYVTSVIEGEISGVKGVSKIRSESRQGFSRIEVELQRDVDVNYLRFAIQERLSFLQDRLPPQALPPRIIKYVPEEIKTTRFMSYHVVGPYNDARLRQIALRQIRPTLTGVAGVAGVEVVGGRDRQIRIVFDEDRLKAFRLLPGDLRRALAEANLTLSAGSFIDASGRVAVAVRQTLHTLHDIETLPLRLVDHRLIRLRDVAAVVDTLSPPYSLQRINGQSTILIEIEKEPGANTIAVADRVYQAVAALERRLPEGIRLLKEDDQSLVIRENLRDLFFRALFGFLVIFLVLTLFLRRLRYAAIVQASIVISVLFTLLLMFLFRFSLNIITLAGLALGFGILVDNAIVVLENIHRRVTAAEPSASLDAGIVSATREVVLPLIASTLTTLAALLPFLYLTDELRIYYLPFAITVSLALLASLCVAFFLIPAVAYRWYRRRGIAPSSAVGSPSTATSPGGTRLERLYRAVLGKALARPWLVALITVWCFGLPVWLLPDALEVDPEASFLRRQVSHLYNTVMGSPVMSEVRPYLNHLLGGSLYLFYRYVDRGELWRWGEDTRVVVSIDLPSGTDIRETDRIAALMERTVLGEEGVAQVRTRVTANFAHMEVRFTRAAQFSVIPFLIKERLITRAARTGNAAISVVGYGPGFSSGYGGMTMNNRLVLSGYNYRDMERYAEGLKRRLEQFRRVRNVRTDLTRHFWGKTTFETTLQLHRERLGWYGLTVGDVVWQTRPYLSQYLYRQRLRLGWEEVPYAVVSRRYDDFHLYQLGQLPIRNPNGEEVRLGNLGQFTYRRVQPVIERENQQYYKVIAFDYLAPYRFTKQFIESFLQTTEVPPGYALKKQTLWWWQSQKARNITTVLIIALLLMYMVLAGLYESFTYPVLIFLIIPLSLIGVFLAYYLTDTLFNQAAYIGVIFLMGIVLNNGIILLDRVNQLKWRGEFGSFRELLVTAGSERLRPILMTTVTTIAGLLPLLLLADKYDPDDIWYTLSLSTIGGLTAATLLGLIVLPTLVLLLERIRARFHRTASSAPV